MTRLRGSRGMTLVECAIALVVSSVLLAAVYAALLAGWRVARAQAALIGVRQNVRAAAAALRSELAGESFGAGDLIRLSDSALVLRATRGLGFVCATPAATSVVLDDSLFSSIRAVDPARDYAAVFREGDTLTSADDRWFIAGISSVRRGACANAAAGTLLVLTGLAAGDLAGVVPGGPVRTFEILEYRRYVDAAGEGWLGVRGPAPGGGWSASSPVAGPLRRRDGVVFRYMDGGGHPIAAPDSVALVEVAIHGLDPRTFTAPGRGALPLADSLTIRIAIGGP